MNWGQYTDLRPGEIYKGKEKAGRNRKEIMKEKNSYYLYTTGSIYIGRLQSLTT